MIPSLSAFPAVRLLLWFLLGTLLGAWMKLPFHPAWVFIIVSALYLATSYLPIVSREYAQSAICSLIILVTGWGSIHLHTTQQNRLESEIEPLIYRSDSIHVAGWIQELRATSWGSRATLQVDSIQLSEGWYKRTFSVIVTLSSDTLSIGEGIKVVGTPQKIFAPKNSFDFDYKTWLARQGIFGQIRAKSISESIHYSAPPHIQRMRIWAESVLRSMLSEEVLGVVKALVLGDKSDLSGEQKTTFARSGISHLMAVSGLHVGFILLPYWFIIPWFWTYRYGKPICIIVLALLLFLYAGLTGFSASVIRASLMALLFTYGKVYQKYRLSLNILAFAAFIMVWLNPFYLWEVGFQLSFGAVFILLTVMPFLQELLPPKWVHSWKGKMSMVIIVGIVVQLGLLPILAYYFGEISWVGPLATLLSLLPAYAIVSTGLIALLTNLIHSGVNPLWETILSISATALLQISSLLGKTYSGFISLNLSSPVLFLLWLSIFFTILARRSSYRNRWLLTTLLLCIIWRGHQGIEHIPTSEFSVHILDVGQGDASLLTTPEHTYWMIDTGIWTPNFTSGERTILPYLAAQGITKLDGIFLSHPHADHIGGTETLLRTLPVGGLYFPKTTYDSNLWKRIIDLADSLHVPMFEVHSGNMFSLSPSTQLYTVWPPKDYQPSNVNNSSLVFRVQHKSTSLLFTGDIEQEVEERLAHTWDSFLDTDVLKAAHHGSRSSSILPILSDITPEIITVSLGDRNKYKHPHRSALLRFFEFTPKVFYTSIEGHIVLSTNGNTWEIHDL